MTMSIAKPALRFSVTIFLLVVCADAHAQWRTFAGGFSSRWKTRGHHGHDQPQCEETRPEQFVNALLIHSPDCDGADFSRGNLDDSIGFRIGRERDLWRHGPLHLVGGGEMAVSYTEYNLSQRDFALVSGALFAGANLELHGLHLGARIGAGPFATSNRREAGAIGFREVSVTIPLRAGAGLRISGRSLDAWTRNTESGERRAPSAREASVMLVAFPESRGRSPWEFATAAGSTRPGTGFGSDRKLRPTLFTRVSASRHLPWRDVQLDFSWSSTAHESAQPSVFRGYDMNFRSKTIDGYGLGLSRTRQLTDRLRVRYGGTLEVADWRDEHQLLTRDGRELIAGIEVAPAASLAFRLRVAPHLAFETSIQKVYWPRIDLSEARFAFGLALTR